MGETMKDKPETLAEAIAQLIPTEEGRRKAAQFRNEILGIESLTEDPCLHKVLTIKYSGSGHNLSHPKCVPCPGSRDSCDKYVSYKSITGRKYEEMY